MEFETGTERLLADFFQSRDGPEFLKYHNLDMELLYTRGDRFDKKVKKAWHKNAKENY